MIYYSCIYICVASYKECIICGHESNNICRTYKRNGLRRSYSTKRKVKSVPTALQDYLFDHYHIITKATAKICNCCRKRTIKHKRKITLNTFDIQQILTKSEKYSPKKKKHALCGKTLNRILFRLLNMVCDVKKALELLQIENKGLKQHAYKSEKHKRIPVEWPSDLDVKQEVQKCIEQWHGIGSNKWADIQLSYYQSIGCRNTGRHWLITLQTKMINVSWDLWNTRCHI